MSPFRNLELAYVWLAIVAIVAAIVAATILTRAP